MASYSPVTTPAEPDTAALLRAAAVAGEQVSGRLLETFRGQGLIPRPRRVGNRGRVPLWRYPSGTERQLVGLLRWRQHTKDPDLLTVLLWLDGFPISDLAVRHALLRGLHAMTRIIEREIDQRARRLGLNPADGTARSRAISELAHTAAAKRGTTPIPRHSRLRASDRAHAVSLMIRMFGLGDKIEATAQDAELVERVLGLAPNGRRRSMDGSGPWLTGPAGDLFIAAEIAAIPNLAAAVTDASEADLATARQMVSVLFRHLPLMVRMTDAIFGAENYVGLAGLSQLDQHPESVIYLTPMVIGMLRAGWAENLEAVTSALRPFPELAAQAESILTLPAATVEANLDGQPAEVRARAHRLIDAAIAGQFDTGTS